MDHLWAPWRMEYLERDKTERDGCVFCKKLADKSSDRENLVLFRADYAFVLMNLYPYTNGHLLICSNEHVDTFEKLNEQTLSQIMFLTKKSMEVIDSAMSPSGYNFGSNVGKAGGAGIAEHIHFHVVPRWDGDTNFMPVVGQSKVIMDGLFDTYDQLKLKFD